MFNHIVDMISAKAKYEPNEKLFHVIESEDKITHINYGDIYDEYNYYRQKLSVFTNCIIISYHSVDAALIGFILAVWHTQNKIVIRRTTATIEKEILEDCQNVSEDIPIDFLFTDVVIDTEDFIGIDIKHLQQSTNKCDTIREGDYDFIQLSSGTTTASKGYCLRYESLAESAFHVIEVEGINSDSVVGSYLTLSHIFGFVTGFMIPLLTGAQCYICKTDIISKNPLFLFHFIEKYRISHISAVVATLKSALEQQQNKIYDLSSVKCMSLGGEKITAVVMKLLADNLTRYGIEASHITNSYGMSEKGSITMENPLFGNSICEKNGDNYVSVGDIDFRGISIRTFNEKGIISDDDIGNIGICNENIAKMYYEGCRRYEIPKLEFGDRRYYFNGDRGFISAGKLYVIGRDANLIIYNGLKINGEQINSFIEELLYNDGIQTRHCFVFNIPNEYNDVKCYIDTDQSVSYMVKDRIRTYVETKFHIKISDILAKPYKGTGINKISLPRIIQLFREV